VTTLSAKADSFSGDGPLAVRARRLVEVDPRGTSQMCSDCGAEVRKDLSVRRHDCPLCGLSLHRDENAARNPSGPGARARGFPCRLKPTVPSPRNLWTCPIHQRYKPRRPGYQAEQVARMLAAYGPPGRTQARRRARLLLAFHARRPWPALKRQHVSLANLGQRALLYLPDAFLGHAQGDSNLLKRQPLLAIEPVP